MAESPSQAPTQAPTTPTASDADTTQYWCYHCEKRVSIETLDNLPICHECKNGFVESIPAALPPSSSPPSLTLDHVDDPSFGSQFLQVLRLIAQATRDEGAPQRRTQDPQSEDGILRIELDGWRNDEEDDDDANENEENEENRNDDEEEDANENEDDEEYEGGEDRSDNENEENIENDDEEVFRGTRRDVLQLRFRDLTQTRTRRNRILHWADILMGDNSIEFRLEVPESDRYIGNPEDYVDAAGYEALLQNLAESDNGRRGAPPAAKSAVLELSTGEILTEQEAVWCAICKDIVNIGETATFLPCGHGYHGDCIVPWLGSRNTCPVCRFELPTDDHEYEEERKKRVPASVGGASGSAGDNSS